MEHLILTSLPSAIDKKNYLAGMVEGYLECAIWTEEDLDGTTFDEICVNAKLKAINECGTFLEVIKYDTRKINAGQMGHDFWLTRNDHGAGFWDRGLEEYGEMLSNVSKHFKPLTIYKGDNNLIFIE
jgi:hypothetical protein